MMTTHSERQDQTMEKQTQSETKICVQCGQPKPLAEFRRRSGLRAGSRKRRGTCRDCRQRALSPAAEPTAAAKAKAGPPAEPAAEALEAPTSAQQAVAPAAAETPGRKKRRRRRRRGGQGAKLPVPAAAVEPVPIKPHKIGPVDASSLRPTRQGFIRMRGKTDNGRRWYQEIDLDLAETLVREHAAVVVNRHTIRRLYSNKEFRKLILTRDQYICRFCGQYGDTIDHLLPRAKGGHTTPDNCVCACNECNQSKADRDLEEFMNDVE